MSEQNAEAFKLAKESKWKRITICLEPDTAHRARVVAAKHNISLSVLIKKLLGAFLNKQKDS